MKTIGETLISRREQLKLSLDDIEKKLHIRKRYLAAMENNDFSAFSSPNYIRGFIKNYCEFLGVDSDKVLPVFRRQYKANEEEEIMPKGVSNPLDNPVFKITPQRAAIISVVLILLVFFIYLFSQARGLIGAPKLVLDEPDRDMVIGTKELVLTGRVNPEATLFINGKASKISPEGEFSIKTVLNNGVNEFIIEAINKNGKKMTLNRNIRYQQQNP